MLNPSQLLPPLPGNTSVITFTVKVNGSVIPDNFGVVAVEVNRCFNRIPYLKMRVLDSGVAEQTLAVSDQDLLSPGNTIEVALGYQREEEVVFSGIIVCHSIKIRGDQRPEVTIEAKDQAVRMTVERKNRYFLEQSDQEIIEAILRDYGADLSASVEANGPTHPEMIQYHATDWDFSVMRAEAAAMLVEARDGEVIVRPPDFEAEAKIVLNYGSSIFEFEASMDARDQYPAAKATSWDYGNQELLEVLADDTGVSAAGGLGGALGGLAGAASVAAGAVGITLPGAPPNMDYRNSLGVDQRLLQHSGKITQPELENWASAQYLKSRLAKKRGRVKMEGIVDIYPGDIIELQNVGLRHSGTALVTAVRQVVSGGTWFTHLQFGLPEEWFVETHPDVPAPPAGGLLPGIEGLQIGVVTRLEGDPDGEDRIQVRLPLVSADGEGVWVRIAAQDAGAERGAFFRPEIEDEVIVGFINNDPRQGVVLGMLNGPDKPAPLPTTDDNHEKGWVTRSGMRLLFNDETSTVTVDTPGGNSLVIDDDAGEIKIEDQNGNIITLNDDGVTVTSAGDVNITTDTGDVNISGINVNVSAQAEFTAEGQSTATLKSSAQTVIEGGIVQIN